MLWSIIQPYVESRTKLPPLIIIADKLKELENATICRNTKKLGKYVNELIHEKQSPSPTTPMEVDIDIHSNQNADSESSQEGVGEEE